MPVVAGAFRAVARVDLRVIGFHEVRDEVGFDRQLRYLRRTYEPVAATDVTRWLDGEGELPPGALWLTFDDGVPSALETASLLRSYGFRATAFVCPSRVDSHEPYWWQIVEEAAELGVLPDGSWGESPPVGHLKKVPDDLRRSIVADCARRIEAVRGRRPTGAQASAAELGAWIGAGHDVGNHTWDHPTLDTCSDLEQEDQVVRAHDWLVRFGVTPVGLALPNGNRASAAERTAREIGYKITALFDDQLCRSVPADGLVSRLRLLGGANLPSTRAVASGAHGAVARMAAAVP